MAFVVSYHVKKFENSGFKGVASRAVETKVGKVKKRRRCDEVIKASTFLKEEQNVKKCVKLANASTLV